MGTRKIGIGYNVALVSLTVLNPQPASEGIQSTQRTFAASGQVYDDGLYVVHLYSALQGEAAYQAVLTSYGLMAARTGPVTIYERDDTWTWVRMNGLAIRPAMGKDVRWRDYFPRDIEILIRDLEAAS